MNLSIVICTYNRADFLKLALESLLPQVLQCSVNDIEVVVVDNNSNDGSFAVIKEFQLKFQSLSLLYFLEKQLILNGMLDTVKQTPLFSLVKPVYNVDPKWLGLAVESIKSQIYSDWN